MLRGIISQSTIGSVAHVNMKQDAGATPQIYDKDGNSVTVDQIPSTDAEDESNGKH